MAERRMLSRKITEHDNFTSLPATAQALYVHLVLSADDDGMCDKINIAISNAHAKQKDLDALADRHYLIRFDSGIYAIKHWGMQNAIRKDRYTPTEYRDELSTLTRKPNGSYAMPKRQPDDNQTEGGASTNWQPTGNQTATGRQPDDNQTLPQDSTGKIKDSVEKEKDKKEKETPTHKYGEYGWVKLTEAQYEKLLSDLGQEELDRCIRYVDESAQKNHNRNHWTDWNLVIRNCHRDRWGLQKPGTPAARPRQYTTAAEYKAQERETKSSDELWELVDKI